MRIVTLNLLNDDLMKFERLQLVIAELKTFNPDIIALQEVDLTNNLLGQLAKKLINYEYRVCSRPDHLFDKEGLVIFSKYKIRAHKKIKLNKQNRVLQLIQIQKDNRKFWVANVHMHWSIFSDRNRLFDAQTILNLSPRPAIIVGDFNATPKMESIKLMLKEYKSAISFDQSKNTYPTPLQRFGVRASIRKIGIIIGGLATNKNLKGWSDTIDYIFIDNSFSVIESKVIFNKSSSNNPKLFASDHYGVLADID